MSRDFDYTPDTDVVDVDEWSVDEHTKPGRATTAELRAECEALALVKQWLDEQEEGSR